MFNEEIRVALKQFITPVALLKPLKDFDTEEKFFYEGRIYRGKLNKKRAGE